MNKKGEIEMRMLVIMILSIIGFIIALFFFVIFKDSLNLYDQGCYLSILSRATTDSKIGAVASYIPIKCTTKKVCVRDDGENCDNYFSGEKEIMKVNLPKDTEAAKSKIEEVSAQAMYDCWRTMGEGKLDLFKGGYANYLGFKTDKVSCVVCSRLAFDTTNQEALSKVDIGSYLRRNKISNSDLTYLQYFTDKTFNAFPDVQWQSVYDAAINNNSKEVKIDNKNVHQYAVVFSQVEAKGYTDTLSNLGKAGILTLGGSMLLAPKTSIQTAGVIARGGFVSVILLGIGATGVTVYSMSNVHAGKVAAASYCGKLTGKNGDEVTRCSGIQIVPYDAKSINSICAALEGSP